MNCQDDYFNITVSFFKCLANNDNLYKKENFSDQNYFIRATLRCKKERPVCIAPKPDKQ